MCTESHGKECPLQHCLYLQKKNIFENNLNFHQQENEQLLYIPIMKYSIAKMNEPYPCTTMNKSQKQC